MSFLVGGNYKTILGNRVKHTQIKRINSELSTLSCRLKDPFNPFTENSDDYRSHKDVASEIIKHYMLV